MTVSRILRTGAATAALALAPALAFGATSSHAMSGNMGSHTCTCAMRGAARAAAAPQARQESRAAAAAHDAFVQRVWTAP